MLYLMALRDDIGTIFDQELETMAKYACSASTLQGNLLARMNSQCSEYLRKVGKSVRFTQMNDHTASL